MIQRCTALLLVLLPFASRSQDREAPDSLRAFVEAMLRDTGSYPGFLHPEEYELVWWEKREGFGYMAMSTRGSGSTLKDFLDEHGQPIGPWHPPHGPCILHWRGARHAVITHDPPTGLIRSTRWYFERKGP